ncbi:hypothetical protein A4G20_10430 [Pasteurellaceae bacterium RH1A]|nr:hypothetical protein A4G20_10430 [Pasteurellaceae bacterium RH1A]
MLEIILYCLPIGLVAGFLAGLFGVGGGTVIVPALVYLLPLLGIKHEIIMPLALGTSFATIVITTFSATQRHNKHGNVEWSVVKTFVPSLVIMVFITGLFASDLPDTYLTKIFAVMMFYLSAKMFMSIKTAQKETKPRTTQSMIIGGGVIGMLSSFAGIGGGAFTVPFLNSRGIEMKRAIGTSSLAGCLLGLGGALSYMYSGWGNPNLPEYSLGYIYLPALVAITTSSFFTSKLGANAANSLPVPTLKKVFAAFLMCVAINMFLK